MITQFIYLILAGLGLSLLVFIHELGHYVVARRVGMSVEVFSIGFGKPFYKWEYQGVKWQICYLLFGGYVKIKGMDTEGSKELHEIPGGFYTKSPKARIQALLAGPIVNIFFALLLFSILWVGGGREKPFQEFSKILGNVDSSSELYALGVRPGDELFSYAGHPFQGKKDLLYNSVLNKEMVRLKGEHIDYFDGQKRSPFDYSVETHREPSYNGIPKNPLGITSLASYLIYTPVYPTHRDRALPMDRSGIRKGDRIVWANGEMVFSVEQLNQIVNESKVLLTVQRGDQTLLAKAPKMSIKDINFPKEHLEEYADWQYEKKERGEILSIPYTLNGEGVIGEAVPFFNEESKECSVDIYRKDPLGEKLQEGDKILAVSGIKVDTLSSIWSALQEQTIQLAVERESSPNASPLWFEEDRQFLDSLKDPNLYKVLSAVGIVTKGASRGHWRLLAPVRAIKMRDFPFPPEEQKKWDREIAKETERIGQIENVQMRTRALRELNQMEERYVLGLSLQDRQVRYNPSPGALFVEISKETWKTLSSLFSGSLNPKWISGPVGIVQVMHHGFSVGVKEALFWLAVVSLNLGFFNLLPIPVLDGGHICFSLWEWITGRPIRAKVMEWVVFPFVIILVSLFIYVTYQDLLRLLQRLF